MMLCFQLYTKSVLRQSKSFQINSLIVIYGIAGSIPVKDSMLLQFIIGSNHFANMSIETCLVVEWKFVI